MIFDSSVAIESLLRDCRSAFRMLVARPGWTMAAILCLAIATGANTAAFTVVNGLLLRPLPFPDSDRLVMIALRDPAQPRPRPFSLREYRELADKSAGTVDLLARTFFPVSLTGKDGARMAQAELVSGNYFDTLRVKPFLGRFFDTAEDRGGRPWVGVLSHRLWSQRFGSNPAIVGQLLRINGHSVLVVGVGPPEFVGAMQLISADLWLPAAIYSEVARNTAVDSVPMFGVMGRLAGDIAPSEAEARLTAAAVTMTPAGASAGTAVVLTPATGFGVPVSVQSLVFTVSAFIYAMMALLMAVACANVASLVLARGVGRSREIAIRLSLGASRFQIARQLLIESFALALAGCVAGSVVAFWLTQAFFARLNTPFQYVSYAINVYPDVRVFAYSAGATALAAILCGIAPIRHAARIDVVGGLKQSAAKGGSAESRRALTLVVPLQFATSAALLIAAGMLVRAYIDASSVKPAFNSPGLLTATLDVDQIRLEQPDATRLYTGLLERLSRIPGVTNVALTRDLPLAQRSTVAIFQDTGGPSGPSAAHGRASPLVASPGYFQTLGLSIREGRAFADEEPSRPLIAVINDAMARLFWPNASAIGRTFRPERLDAEPIEVIGIVSNIVEASSTRPPEPAFYQPFPQEYSARMAVVMRVRGETGPFAAQLRPAVREMNQDLSIVDLRTMDEVLRSRSEQRRIPATALALIGCLALLISAVGLYGVVAYGVRERAREFGIRLALGARSKDIRRLVLRQGLSIVGIGVLLGVAGTLALTRVVRSTLFGIGSPDLTTLAGVCAVLLAAGVAALYFPARWASVVEPAQTLRTE